MFQHNPKVKYEGSYLQILLRKDLYNQMIVVSSNGTFPARFPNIFVDYSLGEMRVGNKVWTNWNKAPLKLWQTNLNFAVFCALSAFGVSSEHLNYKKHSMVSSLYRFHVYYHVRQVLKRLQVPLPFKSGFNATDNLYSNEGLFKLCEGYEVPYNPMKYRDEKFY